MNAPGRWGSFLIVVLLGLCLYLPLLSRNYDLNGLGEAAAVDAGGSGDLFNSNHMLYRPIGYVVHHILAAVGLTGGLVPSLQLLSAIFGALGIGFAYLAMERLTENRTIAFWMSLALGVSWSYWTLSTDVYYYTLAAMFVAAALAVFVHSQSPQAFAACGLLLGLSILACQVNVLLAPGFAVAVLLREPASRRRNAVYHIGLILGTAAAVTGLAYLGAGILIYGHTTLAGLLEWASSYSGNSLPMYGAWSPSRLFSTAGAAFKSIAGMELWMFQFALRRLKNGELPHWVAPLGFAVLAGGMIVAYRLGRANRKAEARTALWLLILYGCYVPFIAWWEAGEPRWFIMSNVFLAALAAIVWSRWSHWGLLKIALPVSVALLGGFNLVTSAWPRHFKASTPTQMASCVAGHMDENDLFLATEWNWAGYLRYIHDRDVLSFIEEVPKAGDKKLALQKINEAIGERHRKGAHVYMVDIKSYPLAHMMWLGQQTGLTPEDLGPYTGSQTFECVYSNFFRLDPAAPPKP